MLCDPVHASCNLADHCQHCAIHHCLFYADYYKFNSLCHVILSFCCYVAGQPFFPPSWGDEGRLWRALGGFERLPSEQPEFATGVDPNFRGIMKQVCIGFDFADDLSFCLLWISSLGPPAVSQSTT
jgi:hypothetical protein